MDKKTALLILSDGFEEIETVTVIDILRRAEIRVVICGLKSRQVIGGHELKLTADKELDEFEEDFAALILPGGTQNAEALGDSAKVRELIQETDKQGKIVAAICASPALVLSKTGILDNKKATCYPGLENKLGPKTRYSEEAVVIDQNIITSRGPATAFAFSLALVEKLTARQMLEFVKEKTLS